jgi:hypothetical protein
VWRRWDQITVLEDEVWLMTVTLSRWVGHPECMRRLPRLNGSKNGYIEGPKFPHLVDRQREQFSLYHPNQIRVRQLWARLAFETSVDPSSFLIVVPVSVIKAEMTLNPALSNRTRCLRHHSRDDVKPCTIESNSQTKNYLC